MSGESPTIDKLLRRAKDLLLLVVAVGAFFANGVKYVGIPEKIAGHGLSIAELRKEDEAIKLRMLTQELNSNYIAKSLEELKQSVRQGFDSLSPSTIRYKTEVKHGEN